MVDLTYPESRDLEDLAKSFRYLGEVETPKLNSSVYTAYSFGVAGDSEILALASATHAVSPMSREGVVAMTDGVAAASREAPVDLIIMESDGSDALRVDWLAFEAGARLDREVIARSDFHGRWIDWGPSES
ncbi:MAG: hypothetical protein QMC74_12385 [Myxococcota bacterium]|jgi:hypothetical protein